MLSVVDLYIFSKVLKAIIVLGACATYGFVFKRYKYLY